MRWWQLSLDLLAYEHFLDQKLTSSHRLESTLPLDGCRWCERELIFRRKRDEKRVENERECRARETSSVCVFYDFSTLFLHSAVVSQLTPHTTGNKTTSRFSSASRKKREKERLESKESRRGEKNIPSECFWLWFLFDCRKRFSQQSRNFPFFPILNSPFFPFASYFFRPSTNSSFFSFIFLLLTSPAPLARPTTSSVYTHSTREL